MFYLIYFLLFTPVYTNERVQELKLQAKEAQNRIQQNNRNATLWVELGMLLHEINHLQPDGGRLLPSVENAYRFALALDLNLRLRVTVMGNLATVLMSMDRIEAALSIMEEAIELASRHQLPNAIITGTLFNYGKALRAVGRIYDAENMYLTVIRLSRGEDSINYAKALASLKEYSTEMKEEVLHLADCFLSFATDSDTNHCRGGLDGWWKSFDQETQSWIFFAAFQSLKHAEDEESINRSWFYLSKGNHLQDVLSGYTSDAESLTVLKNAFPAEVFKRKTGLEDATPIFIFGMPRSGSTLLEQALASHSKVLPLGEDTPFAPLIPELLHSLQQTGLSSLKSIGQKYIEAVRSRIPEEREEVWRTVDKMLNNILNVGFIEMALPSSCLIHIVRHPLDCVCSCFVQPFEGRGTPWVWNLTNISERYRLIYELQQHWDRVLPGRILKVYYEKLVRNFEDEMKKVLQHCSLPWEETILKFHQTKRPVHTASQLQVMQEIYQTSIGQWKKYKKQLQLVEDVLHDLILEYDEKLKSSGVDHEEL